MTEHHHDHAAAAQFDFEEDRHTGVFICEHVAAGDAILYVCHDEEDDWQFLCGGHHGDDQQPQLVCLEHVVAGDPTLNDLADMCKNHSAERETVGGPWDILDECEEAIRGHIAEFGWSVMAVEAGDKPGEPPFSYTIGLFETFEHPELVILGIDPERSQAVLNACGELIRDGHRFADGASSEDVIEGFEVRFHKVGSPESYDLHFGYATWFYDHRDYPALQVLWPDRDGKFPGEADCAEDIVIDQPLLP